MRVHVVAVWSAAILAAVAGGTPALPEAQLTPAQQKIASAEKAIQKSPGKFQAYNDLAAALVRRARETSDTTYYGQAEEALNKSLRLAPDNFEGLKIEVAVLLGKHEFPQALEKARRLNRRTPDDVLVYGYIADAASELGDYDEAEKAAQWMLDLRPGNIPGLLRGANLRTVYGDIEGALDFLSQALQETPPYEVEDVARILTQSAELQLRGGKPDLAEKSLQQALQSFPGYYYALESLARVQIAQHKYVDAVNLLRQRNQISPRPESLYALAEALEQAGRLDEAEASYADFEHKARQQMEGADNANRELIFYYADHTRNSSGAPAPAGRLRAPLPEASRIARLETARRHDIFTLEAYAWALYANGQYAAARTQVEKALAVGIRDASFLYHAGMISLKLNDRAAATRYLKQSLDLNPFSEVATAAREALGHLASSEVESQNSVAIMNYEDAFIIQHIQHS